MKERVLYLELKKTQDQQEQGKPLKMAMRVMESLEKQKMQLRWKQNAVYLPDKDEGGVLILEDKTQ